MSRTSLPDSWLLPVLERMLPADSLDALLKQATGSYWESAVRLGLTSDSRLAREVASNFRMSEADGRGVKRDMRDIVPEGLARRYNVLPLAVHDGVLDLAIADPTDTESERYIAFASGRKVRMHLISPLRVREALDRLYSREEQSSAAGVIDRILQSVAGKYDIQAITDDDAEDLATGLTDSGDGDRPVIKLVDYVLAEGISSRASDIHLEPGDSGLAVRFRVDGVLRQVLDLPRAVCGPLVSRIKIMSGLDIADRLRPQDGRARVLVNGRQVDLRISTLPAAHGEKVVIRILDGASTVMSFDNMGMSSTDLERLRRLLDTREGVILVTGPTGSGKTTTLYTALRNIQQRGGVNIVTVEDPVEYRLPGIVQVQVNEKAGLSFAAALKSILRQDPDVVLVGEIRDRETASTAIQASLTGHLVFSTLHTIDAASSVTRLVDIGVESYKIAAALKGIVAQRLLRRLCEGCRRPSDSPIPRRIRPWMPPGSVHHEAAGCAQCNGTGFRGRIAVLEVLIVDAAVERSISAGEPADQVVAAARAAGMSSLWQSGIHHVRSGLTSVDELLRVLDVPAEEAVVHGAVGRPLPHRLASLTPIATRTSPLSSIAIAPPAPSLPDAIFRLVDEPDAGPEQSSRRHRILLVEDEIPMRGVLRDLLEREGHDVLEAGDGASALEEVDRCAPDLVLLDLTLPVLDGCSVLERLRAHPATRCLPVVVLSAREEEDAEERVFELGADDFLHKPFRPRALMARVRALLRRSDEAELQWAREAMTTEEVA